VDLFIVPGLAFTKNGCRLGHGMGYYDRYLARHQQMFSVNKDGETPTTIALCFAEQIVDDIPTTGHDFPIDFVLSNID